MTGRPWTPEDLQVLRERFPHVKTREIAEQLGRTYRTVAWKAAALGLRKDPEFLHRMLQDTGRRAAQNPASHRGRFQAGGTSWNKGKRGATGHHPNSAANRFLPGTLNGRAAQLALPIGTLRISGEGYLERKVGTVSGSPSRRWKGVHRLVWEAAHGPVPTGHVVVFRPDMHTTRIEEITLERLELMTRSALMKRNSVHTKYPKELARVVHLRGALTRAINRKVKGEPT